MKAGRPWAIAVVIACMMTSYLLVVPGCGQKEEGLRIEKLEVTVEADPEKELLDMTALLHVRRDMSVEKQSFGFLKPTEITRVYDVESDRELTYEINPDPQLPKGADNLTIDLVNVVRSVS